MTITHWSELESKLDTTTIKIMIAQYPSLLIIVKSMGLLSMIASSFIIRHILKKLLGKRRSIGSGSASGGTTSMGEILSKITLTQSIMLCLSCGDFISSFFVPFLSTWMVPKCGQVGVHTCIAQGYISVMFFGLSVYSNASLAVSHCLVVIHNWKDDERQRRRIAFTLTPFICAFIFSIIPLIWENYNYNGGFYCDISASPIGCNTWDPEIECTRGTNSLMVLLFVQLIPFMIAFIVIIVAVSLLCYRVYKQERRMDRYTLRSQQARSQQAPNRKLTMETAYQGIWYIAAFGVTWIPWYCYSFDEITGGGVNDIFDYLHIFTKPLQGLFNSLVYFRPKYLSARARFKTETRLESLCRVLDIRTPRCCSRKKPIIQQHDEEKRVEDNILTDDIEAHEAGDHPKEIDTTEVLDENGIVKALSTLTLGTFKDGQVVLSSCSTIASPLPQHSGSSSRLEHTYQQEL